MKADLIFSFYVFLTILDSTLYHSNYFFGDTLKIRFTFNYSLRSSNILSRVICHPG